MANFWDKIKGTVGKIAPLLGNAIVPGVGGVAGSLIAEVLGVENEPEALDKALANATPEQIVKIKEIEKKHEERLIELGIENDKEYIRDTQNARQREIEVSKATGKRDYNLYVLAWTVVVGFFILCGLLMYRALPEGQNEVVFLLFGGLVAGFGQVLGYFFGSSKSSAEKTQLMMARKP